MGALHIRDIGDTLIKELKTRAAEEGVTLKQYVIWKLEGRHGDSDGGGAVEPDRGTKIPIKGRRKSGVAGRSKLAGGGESGGVATVREVPEPAGGKGKLTSGDEACGDCGHARMRHRDFSGACFENVCRCGRFK